MEENKKFGSKGFKIFIIIFLTLSMFLLKEENQNKLINFINSVSGKEKVLELVNSFKNNGDIQNINIYDKTIVKWSNNKISFMKIDGTPILEKEFNFTEPYISYGDKYIYVADKSTGDIYCLDKNGETKDRLQLNKEIFNLKESHENLIYHIKSPDTENIKIIDKDGALILNQSYEGENILTYNTNNQGNLSAISSLSLNGEILKSKIDCYGENNEKLNSIDIDSEIIIYLDFTAKDDIIALSDSSLYFIKEGKTIWEKQFDLIKDIYLGKDKVYILYSNYLEIIGFDGKSENKISFTDDYKKILPFQGGFLIYGDNKVVIIEGNKEILKHEDNIIRILTNKDQILLWGPEEIKVYRISSKNKVKNV
ncbi:DUF5711 family protein [Tissierella sp.]|uniref:DUF5711 family protein n=1 Tax=Tissierella sp. TaxID=41274 RepID=UPI0028B1BA02|nr:DUF5711 family protein [Tissierella sp.]